MCDSRNLREFLFFSFFFSNFYVKYKIKLFAENEGKWGEFGQNSEERRGALRKFLRMRVEYKLRKKEEVQRAATRKLVTMNIKQHD